MPFQWSQKVNMKRPQMVGEQFGILVVRERAGVNREGRVQWHCICACGNEAVVLGTLLRLGTTQSCGCLRKGCNATHGMSGTLTYSSWSAMLHRCEDPSRNCYESYGGRGIKVCARWHDFLAFLTDMGVRPSMLHSIERVNNAVGYEPGNCVWATNYTQTRNTRRNTRLTHEGKTMTMIEWAEFVGSPHSTLSWRKQQGWSDTDVIYGRRK